MAVAYKTQVTFMVDIVTMQEPKFVKNHPQAEPLVRAHNVEHAIHDALRSTFDGQFMIPVPVTTITKTIPLTEAT